MLELATTKKNYFSSRRHSFLIIFQDYGYENGSDDKVSHKLYDNNY